jgi:hypothetical protein
MLVGADRDAMARAAADFPRMEAVNQQTQRWLRAGCFEVLAHDLWMVLRLAAARTGQLSAVILDARTVQSPPESGAAGYDGQDQRPSLSKGEEGRAHHRIKLWSLPKRRKCVEDDLI